MKIIVEKDYEGLSARAAQLIKKEIDENPRLVLGLATGSTPLGTYERLIDYYKKGQLDFSSVEVFNLDEYVGLSGDHPSSYKYFMEENLFSKINIDRSRAHIPDGMARDLKEQCRAYDELIDKSGGIDLQILGLGTNGHIAFNEPSLWLNLGTSQVELTENTIRDNSRFFDSMDQVPKTALSLGMGGILKAKRILLLASGRGKKEVMEKFFNLEHISTDFPVSLLLLHRNLTVIVDEEVVSG